MCSLAKQAPAALLALLLAAAALGCAAQGAPAGGAAAAAAGNAAVAGGSGSSGGGGDPAGELPRSEAPTERTVCNPATLSSLKPVPCTAEQEADSLASLAAETPSAADAAAAVFDGSTCDPADAGGYTQVGCSQIVYRMPRF